MKVISNYACKVFLNVLSLLKHNVYRNLDIFFLKSYISPGLIMLEIK